MQGGQHEEMKCMNARPYPVDVFGDKRRQLQGSTVMWLRSESLGWKTNYSRSNVNQPDFLKVWPIIGYPFRLKSQGDFTCYNLDCLLGSTMHPAPRLTRICFPILHCGYICDKAARIFLYYESKWSGIWCRENRSNLVISWNNVRKFPFGPAAFIAGRNLFRAYILIKQRI